MKNILKKTVSLILIFIARQALARHKPKVVAITGNVGKTGAKDAIAAVLTRKYTVRKSDKSFNSDIGVPLAILGLPNAWANPFGWFSNFFRGVQEVFSKDFPQVLVLEVGADRPRDIADIMKWLKPDIGVVTVMGKIPVHIEFFGSLEEVAKEKAEVVLATKESGNVILNFDDKIVSAMAVKSRAQVLTFGFNEGAFVRGENSHIYYEGEGIERRPAGTSFKIIYDGNVLPVHLPGIAGKNASYSALAAFACGISFEINPISILEALGEVNFQPGRMRIIEGNKKTTIIDDTYNSSPVAVEHALEILSEIETDGRKIAVIGDMMELGNYTPEAHRSLGTMASKIVDILVCVGVRAKFIADGALSSGMTKKKIMLFDDSLSAGKALDLIIKKGDTILVKGSQYMRMERTVLEIMAEPARASELLVRQEEEWGRR